MPTFYKNLFISGEVVAHWRRRSGNGIEIRCQIAGKKITASGKTRQIAAERFIARLQSSENPASGLRPGMLFRDFAVEWLQTAKRPNVKPATYVDYLSIFRAHLLPAFGDRRIDEIRQMEIQSYLNALLAAGKSRAAQKHLQILKSLFQTAVENDIIKNTPATGVKIPFHETETGQALSRDETRELVARCLDAGTRTGKAFIFFAFHRPPAVGARRRGAGWRLAARRDGETTARPPGESPENSDRAGTPPVAARSGSGFCGNPDNVPEPAFAHL